MHNRFRQASLVLALYILASCSTFSGAPAGGVANSASSRSLIEKALSDGDWRSEAGRLNGRSLHAYDSRSGKLNMKLRDFASVAAGETQEAATWCWAACVVMVQKWESGGRDAIETQKQVVERIKSQDSEGPGGDQSAHYAEVVAALTPSSNSPVQEIVEGLLKGAANTRGRIAGGLSKRDLVPIGGVLVSTIIPDRRVFLSDLYNGHPLVVGLRDSSGGFEELGHAYVVAGAKIRLSKPGPLLGDLIEPFLDRLIDELEQDPRLRGAPDLIGRLGGQLPKRVELTSVTVIDPVDGQTKEIDGKSFLEDIIFCVGPTQSKRLVESWSLESGKFKR